MPRLMIILGVAALLAIAPGASWGQKPQRAKLTTGVVKKPDVPEEYKDVPPVLRFKMRDIDGKEVALKEYQGKVIMMVNTASKCGYTPQYKALQEMYDKYKDQGFVILAFPSNDFGAQEPGDAAEIKKFCTDNYKVTFPLFDKVQVKSKSDACDLYKFLTGEKKSKFPGPIRWNFTKFVIDRKGELRGRFESKVEPTDKKITDMVERLLKASAGKKAGENSAQDNTEKKPAEKKPADKNGAPPPQAP